MIYIVTGYLGAGKSLIATQRLIDYAAQGRKVAANYDFDFLKICSNPNSKLAAATPIILPSVPHSNELKALGLGGTNEEDSGALVLDEAAQFLNSRQWNGDDRQNIINWLLHTRKLFWDVFLLVQHERMLDKQIREALGEYIVTVRRTDRMKIPLTPIKFPRMHIAIVRYGLEKTAPVSERWFTRGAEPIKCYNSYEVFDTDAIQTTRTIPSAASRMAPVKKSINLLLIFKHLPGIILYYTVKTMSPKSLPLILKIT